LKLFFNFNFHSSRATLVGVYEISEKYILRTDRPATDDRPTNLTFGKISNGHISARGRPIHFMFGSTVGFSGSADRMALFPTSSNSIGDISTADHPIYSVFHSRMGFSVSADRMALFAV